MSGNLKNKGKINGTDFSKQKEKAFAFSSNFFNPLTRGFISPV